MEMSFSSQEEENYWEKGNHAVTNTELVYSPSTEDLSSKEQRSGERRQLSRTRWRRLVFVGVVLLAVIGVGAYFINDAVQQSKSSSTSAALSQTISASGGSSSDSSSEEFIYGPDLDPIFRDIFFGNASETDVLAIQVR